MTRRRAEAMRIFIDADGCPVVRQAVDIGIGYGAEVIIISDTAHIINVEGATCLTVDKGSDSADFAIVARCSRGDVVLTQDYALAALCLTKGAAVINQNGVEYTNDNIDSMLMGRYVSRQIRRRGGRTPHMKKRTNRQDFAFEAGFKGLINKLLLTNNGNMI